MKHINTECFLTGVTTLMPGWKCSHLKVHGCRKICPKDVYKQCW